MEAAALTTYTAATQEDPEAIGPGDADLQANTELLTSSDLEASVEVVEVTARDGDAAPAKTFRDFGIAEPICAALEAEGITTAFPIQALTLPVALSGHDLIGQARTGTGKTLAFGVPILQRLDDMPGAGIKASPRALAVVPTRELAFQVAQDLEIAGRRMGAKVVVLYGGRAYEPQIEALASVDIVVGTPGLLLDLVRQGHLHLGHVHALVLDEADKMLDLGFLPDVERILSLTPNGRQTMLFSATMPGEIVTLARRHLSLPMHIRAEHHDEPTTVPTTEQHVYRAHQMDKIEVLARVLQAEGRGLSIVFCRTKRSADQVSTALTTRGFAAGAVHGDLGQGQRERAMRAFRAGKVDVLVATDVAARGLDVDDVTHVINYECPEDEKAYLHRIGRTGRAGRTGVAVTFVDWNDLPRWKLIDETLKLGHPEPLETYSTSEHLFTDLQIPAGTNGVLPRVQAGAGGPGGRGARGHRRDGQDPLPRFVRPRSRPPAGRPPRGARRRRRPEPAQRRARVRRRTRSGVQLAEGAAASPGSGPHAPASPAEAGTAGPAAGEGQRRRRRRRPARGSGSAQAPAAQASAPPASAPADGYSADRNS